jgi:hypothetical protein
MRRTENTKQADIKLRNFIQIDRDRLNSLGVAIRDLEDKMKNPKLYDGERFAAKKDVRVLTKLKQEISTEIYKNERLISRKDIF